MRPRLDRFAMLALTLCAALCASPISAQSVNWPTKPVNFIVPFPPGGTLDPLARLLAVKLNESMGQQFLVQNKPGASGSIGTAYAAKSAPDGYTFAFVFDTHAVNPTLLQGISFDTLKDLVPVMLISTAPMAYATHPSKPYKTFAEVIAAAKAKPDTIAFGSIGNGSLGHLTTTMVQRTGNFKLIHVPYKGGGPLTQDALGGQIDLAIGSVALLAPHIKAGRLRGVAVTGDKRSHTLPDVPSLSEQGFPGFSALAWWGIFAPSGTPKLIIDKFHTELGKALALPDLRKTLTEQMGMDLVVSTPEALQKFLVEEIDRWGKVVRENNIRAD